jgi:hypothetical protein
MATTLSCDICHQTMERKQLVNIWLGLFGGHVELCRSCATPVLAFLKEHQLVDEQQMISLEQAA